MHPILSVVLGSMHADLARVDRSGMNIANAHTPGYKREVAVSTFSSRVEAATLSAQTDLRPGTLKPTGQDLDLAIVGDAWFEVATPEGPAHTRQGNFRLDNRGRLVTQQGRPVMGNAGEIQLLHGNPLVDETGRVFERAAAGGSPLPMSASPIAQIRLVQIERGAASRRLGDGLLRFEQPGVPAAEGSVQVLRGHLENSNVSHLHEMVRLMEAVRHFETMQKVAVGYDEMLGASIRRLGEP